MPTCPNCRAALPADSPDGLCPRCLLGAAPTEGTAPPAPGLDVPSAAELAPLFPQLEVLELLGQGGMGAVYKARQPALDRLVALKVLPRGAERDPAFAERFTREARALARLDHPHIVTVYDFGQSGGLYYLLMEYVDGTDLRRAMSQGPLPPSAALRVVEQTCAALQYAHEEGVVHRDVKPENILLTKKGSVKIADFGLAKLLGRSPADLPLTATQQVMGTRHYMAPEQEQRPLTVDHRADIYSLGVVFYELLTGELPVGNFAPPSRKSAADARLDEVVMRALAQEPELRFQHAGDMHSALEAIEKTPPAGPTPPAAKGKLPRWAWLAAGVAVIGLVLFEGWRLTHASPTPGDTFRWGGDPSGGEPYIIERESGQQPRGFEGDLAEYLAGKLGLRPEFVRKDWAGMRMDLPRGDIDVILNGYEWFADAEKAMSSTIPYYAYRLRLLVRRDSPVREWADLRRRPGEARKKVCVLGQTAAYRYLKEQYAGDVEIIALDAEGTTTAMTKVVRGEYDATVQDDPVVAWYMVRKHEYPELWAVPEAVKPFPYSFYVLYTRKDDKALRQQLDQALLEAIQDGTLGRIYETYGLPWSKERQEELLQAAKNWPPAESGSGKGMAEYAWVLTKAAGMTVLLACLAMPLAMAAGLLLAVGRLYGPRWLAVLLNGYVEVVRGTPLLFQLWVIFYLLPYANIYLPAFWAGILGLAVNYSAYEAENYRAGLLAIPRGQMEAALALGMGRWVALRRVIIPQAVRIVIPPVTNDFISLFKDTSVCSVIAVYELTWSFRELMVNNPKKVWELGLIAALLYLLMSVPLSLLARRLERRFPKVVV
ncbi:MAG TPA: ABC transporter permease subunit [Gemmataceae bacterium]|nr:ABC transporter permease subunit [Gemmataceae bacterium]